MRQKNCILWTRVEGDVKQIVMELVKSQGITISEYIRQLVINDLDKRSVFTAILKNQMLNQTSFLDTKKKQRVKYQRLSNENNN